MATNPLIALMGRTPDIAGSLERGINLRNSIQQSEREAQVGQQTIELNDERLAQIRNDRAARSVAQGAYVAFKSLEGNDVEGTKNFLKKRAAELESQGRDASDTLGVLQRLESGDVQGARGELQQAVQMGLVSGILKSPGGVKHANIQRTADGRLIGQNLVTGNMELLPLPEGVQLQDEDPERGFNQESTLRGEFTKQSQDFVKQNASFGRIQASANEPSAAGDLALVFNYMKLLDPGSTVRESEFANAKNAGGVPDRVRATFNSVLRGESLSGAQRADFFDRAKKLFEEANRQHGEIKNRFTELSRRNHLNPENVVIDLLTADPDREVNLQSGQERKTLNGQTFVKINGQWYQE